MKLGSPTRRAWPRSRRELARAVAPWLVLALALPCAVHAFARAGFNPTDDGLILAQAERILSGASPHSQIASPRPLGSPLLHVVDLVAPAPLLLTSRVVVLMEMLLTSILAVRFLVRRPVAKWTWPLVLVALSGFVLNLHSFPVMTWHTVDGVLVIVASLVLVQMAFEQGRLSMLASAFLLAGYATLIKQSFAFGPVLIAGLCVQQMLARRSGGTLSRRQVLAACSFVFVAPLAYAVWLLMTNSWSDAVAQMFGAESVNPVGGLRPGLLPAVLVVAGGVAVAALASTRRHRRPAPRNGVDRTDLIRAALSYGLVLAAMLVIAFSGARLDGDWGASIWWFAALSVAAASTVRWSIDTRGLCLLAVGWMASLSWGYSNPDLFAGSLLAICLVNASVVLPSGWCTSVGVQRRAFMRVASVGVVLCALVVVGVERSRSTYRDVPSSEQAFELGDIATPGRWVMTGPTTGKYLLQIKSCIEQFPATRLAVVPDNAVVPLLLGKANPLPVAWWDPKEVPTDHNRLHQAIRRSLAEGDYLVLFQTVDAASLAATVLPESVTPMQELFDRPGGVMAGLFNAMDGEIVTCGSFIGRYHPSP